ncbi:hypothetical protein EUGRSUZ_K00065 [Eucalyptus grandis]|nr:hypothetical protein EUGRSUZ_K00065 [Eucalyptus grandis]
MRSPPPSSSRKEPKPTSGKREEEEEEEEEEDEEETILVALIEHRTKEVDHLRHRVSYYTSQLHEAQKRLHDSKGKLALLRSKHSAAAAAAPSSSSSVAVFTNNGTAANVKTERRSTSPIGTSSGSKPSSRSNAPPPPPPTPTPSILHQSPSARPVKEEKPRARPSPRDSEAIQDRGGTRRKLEHKEHRELIPLIRSASSPFTIRCQTSSQVPSQHKRKLRSLALCPAQELLFATSALDGVVNLWQIQANG